MDSRMRYKELKRPTWAPPSWVFGPVWSVLYVMIAISFGKVFVSVYQEQTALVVAVPFLLNIIFNIAFTPIQFGLKNNLLASIDILLILATLVWSMIVIFPLIPWVMYMQVPYLLWVSFATVLQLTITYINRGK